MTCVLAHTYFLLLDYGSAGPVQSCSKLHMKHPPLLKNLIDKLCSVILHHYTLFTTLAVNISMYNITLLLHFITILLSNSLFNH